MRSDAGQNKVHVFSFKYSSLLGDPVRVLVVQEVKGGVVHSDLNQTKKVFYCAVVNVNVVNMMGPWV